MKYGLTAKAPRETKQKIDRNHRGAEETQGKAITAKARRRKEKPQRTSEFLILFLFSFAFLCASVSLRLKVFIVFPGALGVLAVNVFK